MLMSRKKWLAAGVIALAFLLTLNYSIGLVFGQPKAVTELGKRNHLVVSSNIISTVPTSEERRNANALRTRALELGQSIANDSALNKNRDELFAEQQLYYHDPSTHEFRKLNKETIVKEYHVKYPSNGENLNRLYLYKVETDAGIELIPDHTTATPALIASPDGEQYVFENGDSIFTIDAETLAVQEVTQDSIGQHNKSELRSQLKDGDALFWAAAPQWSPDGQHISYLSNRSNIHEGMEIWTLELSSGNEQMIYRGNSSTGVYSWIGVNELLIWEEEGDDRRVKSLTLDGNAENVLLENVDVLDVSADGTKVLYSESRPSQDIWVLDLQSNEKTQIAAVTTGIQFDPIAYFSPSGNLVSALEYTGPNGERTVHIIDINAKQTETHPSSDVVFYAETPNWLNEDTLLVNGKHAGQSESWLIKTSNGGGADE